MPSKKFGKAKKNRWGAPKATDRKILEQGNRCKSVTDLMERLGYGYANAGSSTINRFKRILGTPVYENIASGSRNSLPRTKWVKN